MSSKKNRQKVRADFRKKHQGRVRQSDLTRKFHGDDGTEIDDMVLNERVSGKGELTRKRTVIGSEAEPEDAAGLSVHITRESGVIGGRVLSVHGLQSRVLADDGEIYQCAVRQLLKSLNTDQRHVVAAGDRVGIRPEQDLTGMIHSVAPRRSSLCRTSRGRQQVIVSNVDALLIVVSAAQPDLKPGLIDRFLLTAERFGIRPVVCINKVDLVNQQNIQRVTGVFAQLGYPIILTSIKTGQGIDYLKAIVKQREAAFAGQSGVGKSSLLNAIEPGLSLRVGEVSRDNDKGRHTTTAAQLIPLESGGFVVDTPGIRQFQLWDITASEVAGMMPDLRPYVSHCRYPDCLHIQEDGCAVKEAVADGKIDARRYDSYCNLIEEELV